MTTTPAPKSREALERLVKYLLEEHEDEAAGIVVALLAEKDNVWEALQSSEAYRDARMMWHVGGVLTEAGEEHLALTFSAKDARISKLEKDLYASRELIRGIQFDCDCMRTVRDAERAEVDRLRTALLEAIECVDFWGSYASDYFKEKHDLAGEIARLTATATTKPQETE